MAKLFGPLYGMEDFPETAGTRGHALRRVVMDRQGGREGVGHPARGPAGSTIRPCLTMAVLGLYYLGSGI